MRCVELKGWFVEVFSSFQGEGGAVRGSCLGRRQIFMRLSGCHLRCVWCDTPEGLRFKIPECRVEQTPGRKDFALVQNPVDTDIPLQWVRRLKTSDLHSISFTGGEPLDQADYLRALCECLKDAGHLLFLETSASLPREAEKVKHLFDYVSADIKDKSAAASKDWKSLFLREIETMKIFVDAGKIVTAKIVVTGDSRTDEMELFARELAELNVPLALQVVTPFGPIKFQPTFDQISALSQAALRHLKSEDVSISYQMHKALSIL